MAADALPSLSLREVSERIGSSEVSPVEVTEQMLTRIESVDPGLNAYISVFAENALLAAEAAEKAIAAGYRVGPLHGVPIALKDLIATRAEPMTAGSKILGEFTPPEDATVAARLRAAGALFVGKLNMHEFAYGVTTNNPHHGAARNPWKTERTPGGSSGGSGAAVAARLCYGALGSDTGCSVRLPAAFNGITGIRPTIGRVSNFGVVTLAWTLDTVGPMCRTAEDCALMLAAMAGHDPRDQQTATVGVPDYAAELERGLQGMRLAVIEDFTLSELQPDVEARMRTALEQLEKGGAQIREVAIQDLEPSLATSALLTVDIAEPAAYHAQWIRERPDDYGEDVRGRVEMGELYLATHYIQAQRYRTIVRDQFVDVLEDADAIITPAVPFTAPEVDAEEVELGEVVDIITAVMRYQALPPLTGMPAMSVPCGFSSDGLPIGMQIVGRPFGEGTVFRIGHGYQALTDWHTREPEL
jgi:aspartyl-tRNA(Asn)/glutamyl-tRNA(Gln) amidotransferase subunit A